MFNVANRNTRRGVDASANANAEMEPKSSLLGNDTQPWHFSPFRHFNR